MEIQEIRLRYDKDARRYRRRRRSTPVQGDGGGCNGGGEGGTGWKEAYLAKLGEAVVSVLHIGREPACEGRRKVYAK